MAVHYDSTRRYEPKTDEEEQMILRANCADRSDEHKHVFSKCSSCKKKMRGPLHDCKNGK